MPKSKKSASGRASVRSVVPSDRRSGPPTVPQRLVLGNHEITADEILRIPERRPYGEGPWEREPDRVAWIDAQTSYPCLILRQPDGTLAGFVAVKPDHPLWRFERDAIPTSVVIKVHRGIDYAAICREDDPPSVRICHPGDNAVRGRVIATPGIADIDVDGGHAAWWFGFNCNKASDFLPEGYALNDEDREDGPREYRDIAYVADQTVSLARQLKALQANPPVGTEGAADSGVPLVLGNHSKALRLRKGGRDDV
ncbi:hypothetical protein J3454_15365 [Erythrobacter sp. NFXS35]|uniref:hypothetical protein n=1 Tax=Erythrobacter sp. NFXS35 TaxID=2818436 RepID=UPI0032DE7300